MANDTRTKSPLTISLHRRPKVLLLGKGMNRVLAAPPGRGCWRKSTAPTTPLNR